MRTFWNLRLGLFVLTILSSSFSASFFLLGTFNYRNPWSIFDGLPFALTLISILLLHEMGHFVVIKWWGFRNVKGPLFIPLPFSPLGTLGAVINLNSPVPNRKALFDISVSGPWAGMLATAAVAAMKELGVFSGKQIEWSIQVGLLLTFVNLFPLGMLDGGRVFYSIFGRNLIFLRIMILFFLVFWFQFQILFLLAIFILLFGLRHPPTQNDHGGLDIVRKILAFLTGALFAALIMVVNFNIF